MNTNRLAGENPVDLEIDEKLFFLYISNHKP